MKTSTPGLRIGIAVAVIALFFGIALFIVKIMVPNLVGSGQRAASQTAVSQLRTLLWTQDRMKEVGGADRDGDGIGEYAFLASLSNRAPVKALKPLTIPLLEGPLGIVAPGGRGGVATLAAYCYAVFLPASRGGAVAELPAGGEAPGSVDPDGAERFWVAYAWPVQRGAAGSKVFFINQDEEIWEAPIGTERPYVGPANGPAFDAALPRPDLSLIPVEGQPGGDGAIWKRWKNKKGRKRT